MTAVRDDLIGDLTRNRKLPKHLEQLFRDEQFRGVYLASSIIPMPRYGGDNRLGRPIKIGPTKAFSDNLSQKMLGHSPYVDLYVNWRIWTIGDKRQKHLEVLLKKHIAKKSESIHRGWAHMDGEFDPKEFQKDAFKLATKENIIAFSDGAVLNHLETILRENAFRKVFEEKMY
jgi:hypothetical protein